MQTSIVDDPLLCLVPLHAKMMRGERLRKCPGSGKPYAATFSVHGGRIHVTIQAVSHMCLTETYPRIDCCVLRHALGISAGWLYVAHNSRAVQLVLPIKVPVCTK